MRQTIAKKTNRKWYAYEEYGSYYKLLDGVLYQSPMNADGTLDGTVVEVDWDNGVTDEDEPKMLEIVKELEQKE